MSNSPLTSPLTILARIKAKPGLEARMQQDLISLLAPLVPNLAASHLTC